MPRKTTPSGFVHRPTQTRVPGRLLACAVSLLAVGAMDALAPNNYAFVPTAAAQSAATGPTEALFLAIERNDLQAVQEAVANGADIEARDFTGSQPVDLAIDRGFSAIARYLISVRNAQAKNAQKQPPQPQAAQAPEEIGTDLFSGLANEIGGSTGSTPRAAPTPPPATAPAPVPAPAPAPEPKPVAAEPEPEPAPEPAPAPEQPPELAQAQTPAPETAASDAPLPETPAAKKEDPFSNFTDHGIVEPPAEAEPAPLQEPAEGAEPPQASAPFDSPTANDGLPIMGNIQEPVTPPAESAPEELAPQEPAQVAQTPPSPTPAPASEPAPVPAEPAAMAEPQPQTELAAKPDDEAADEEPAPGEPANVKLTIDEPLSASASLSESAPKEVEKPVEPVNQKPSAAKQFFSTFLDFFKPPNVTGVVRKKRVIEEDEDTLSEEELARQLQELEAERGVEAIKGPEVPITAEELEKQLPPAPVLPDDLAREIAALPTPELDPDALPDNTLPPYPLGTPQQSAPLPPQEDVFANIAVEEAAPQDLTPAEPASTPFDTAPSQATEAAAAAKDIYRGPVPPVPNFKEAPGVPGQQYNSNLPFGGGVDPDVLAYLGLDERTGRPKDGGGQTAPATQSAQTDDPFAGQKSTGDNPFELVENDKETKVSELLDGLDEPQEVAKLEPKPAPSRAADDPFAAAPPAKSDDPFAAQPAPSDDPFAKPAEDVDELAGLLEGVGEQVEGDKGWDVSKVEGGDMPAQVVALSDIEPTGQVLDGVELSLGMDTTVGKKISELRVKLMDQETIHKPCLKKTDADTLFCIDTLSWPFELEEDFLVDTIMYQGTRAIARYDAGHATHYHTLFRTNSFEKIISYYTQRYGEPTDVLQRSIAPLAAPRQDNPTYIWQSREPGTDAVTSLEIRKYDDADGGGFPDIERGVILLYRNHAKPIFPQLSQLELMVLKPDDVGITANESNEKDNTSIWN